MMAPVSIALMQAAQWSQSSHPEENSSVAPISVTHTISIDCVALAVTVHKAQGMTVDQAVLNIARKDFVVGLTYVAVSRVKSLSSILFESPFDFIRFKGIPTHTETMRL